MCMIQGGETTKAYPTFDHLATSEKKALLQAGCGALFKASSRPGVGYVVAKSVSPDYILLRAAVGCARTALVLSFSD